MLKSTFVSDPINCTITTELCSIMNRYGSDKGLGWHNYTTVYTPLFASLRDKPINIFEVGLGTNNIYIPSNMGANGKPGASLKGWDEYFYHKDTKVFGADIDSNILFQTDRIKTFFVNQLNSQTIASMWAQIPEQMDIILDDGLHETQANWNFLASSAHKVKPGGYYIIEDLVASTQSFFEAKLQDCIRMFGFASGEVLSIPNERNNVDNCLVILQKPL